MKKIIKFILMELVPLVLIIYLISINGGNLECGTDSSGICILPLEPLIISVGIVFTIINIYYTFKDFSLKEYILFIILGIILSPVLCFILLWIFY